MTDSWWREVDDATLSALAAAGGTLTLAELATRLRMSEHAVRSVVAMLAEQGAVRIAAVELARPHPVPQTAARKVVAAHIRQAMAIIRKSRRSRR